MSDEPTFVGPHKPSSDEVREAIAQKLDEVDLESISEVFCETHGEGDTDPFDDKITQSDELTFSGPPQPCATEVKQAIMQKLDMIDLELLASLTGSFQNDTQAWTRVIWTVWRR